MTKQISPVLPAEWYPQSGVMLTWPHPHSDWLPWLTEVEPVFVAIAREVASREGVLISCYDAAHNAHIHKLLLQAGVDTSRVRFELNPSNDTWARDHGPISILHADTLQILDFGFNGWGRKYPYELDNDLTRRLHQQGAFGTTALQTIDLILEGGSIESDGHGTLLTTKECLLSPERNPQFDCDDLEAHFARLFGIERVLWLKHGELAGDDTDGHIDTLARFCDPHTIAYVSCDNPADEHYTALQAMAEELRNFVDYQGKPYRLVELPLPSPVYGEDGGRLPATYANFLIINGAVLLPTYRDPLDELAHERLQSCFPAHQVIAIDALPLVKQYGSLHCVTMQLPYGLLSLT